MNKSFNCEVVCFSVNSFTIGYMLRMVKMLHDNKYKGKVILGGIHATHYPKEVLKNPGIDYVVAGEAENVLPQLIKCIELHQEINIPNVYGKNIKTVKSNKLLNINNLEKNKWVFPAYDLVPSNIYETITIETSRGCYGNCTFCSIPNKKCWRSFPKDYIIENINKAIPIIQNKFTKESIVFTDDCFTMNVNRACDLLKLFSDMPIRNFSMLIEARLAQLSNDRVISHIKNLNNITVQVGIECGYDEGLNRINKGITVNQILESSKKFYNKGINKNIFYSFIIGFPWESAENCMKTLEFMSLIKNKYGIAVNCSWWIPVPSIDFEFLKKQDKTISNDIFNVQEWIGNPDKFTKI